VLYFSAFEEQTGYELWKSDGSMSGTVLVSDIAPGPDGSFPRLFENVSGRLLFWTGNGPYAGSSNALLITDGTAEGTVRLKSLAPIEFGGEQPDVNFAVVGDNLYFAAYGDSGDIRLWKSDGTVDGTVVAANLTPYWLAAAQGRLYFSASDDAHGGELWVSDGSATGTVMVEDIFPGTDSSSPVRITAVNGDLFFGTNDGVHGTELWMLPRRIVPGDIDLDGQSSVADVSVLMNAVSDLNAYEDRKSLSSQDLLAVADTNRDGMVNNADIQSLIVRLANDIGPGSA
jgi:ELWxxDGT repeat protein